MAKRKKKFNFVTAFIKKNNVEHTNPLRFIAGGHNSSDARFLKGNDLSIVNSTTQNA